jgi:hypothetical protein
MRARPRWFLVVGGCAALAVIAGLVFDPDDFFRSYLFSFLFCLGLSLGGLANLMLHELTGGRWGLALRRPWTAAARLVPLTLVLFVPMLFGLPLLYHWIGAQSAELARKAWWLNRSFFLLRAGIYFLVWIVLSWRWLSLAARAEEPRPAALRRWSALGLILYGLTISLAAVDWIMSLMPEWYSTTFGLLIGTSQMLSGMALAVAACTLLGAAERPERAVFQDFGNLLLMYVMSWAYLAFTQYLIIWAEDLPKETLWYVPRVQTSWRWLSLAVLVLQFALPFALLLLRVIKASRRSLGLLAFALLVAQLLFDFYLVTPALKPQGFSVSWSDPLAVLAVVGLWLAAWLHSFNSTNDQELHPARVRP